MNEPLSHLTLSVRHWALTHALVFGLVGLVASALGALQQVASPWADDLDTRLIVVLGALLTSIVQGRLLRQRISGWAKASLLGASLGVGLALLTELALPDQPQGELGPVGLPWSMILSVLWVPCLGLGIGLNQGQVLRRYAPGSPSWAAASLLS